MKRADDSTRCLPPSTLGATAHRPRYFSEWLDEGADRAPDRFVWAALEKVERAPQRDARLASAEEFLMKFKRAAPVLGIAAAIVLAIVTFQLVDSPRTGDDEPTSRTYTAEDLERIVITESNAPDDVTVNVTRRGWHVINEPLRAGGPVMDRSTVLEAMTSELDIGGAGYATWGAVFETEHAAREAFEFLVEEHDSPEGWNVEGSLPEPATVRRAASGLVSSTTSSPPGRCSGVRTTCCSPSSAGSIGPTREFVISPTAWSNGLTRRCRGGRVGPRPGHRPMGAAARSALATASRSACT